jgi:23S rRNA pseudouridine1911/1915/1917 synthase
MSSLEIPILYEDADFLVLNKPAGISVHGDGRNDEYTIADWLMEKYPNIKDVGEPAFVKSQLSKPSSANSYGGARPGIVHRLDKDTTGVLLVAKNQPTFLFLKEQFKNHSIKKTYRLIVNGEFKQEEGTEVTIDLPIGRSKNDPRLRVARLKSSGKLREAVTDYKILKKFKDFTYLEAYPKTGRTHQLRAHFKAISHPLACDQLYAPDLLCPTGLGRQALHAFRLEFNQPNGEKLKIEAPLPADFQTALENLERTVTQS